MLEDDADGEPRRRACASRRRSPATRCGSTSPAPTPQVEGNLNCPLSVTKSAAFFAVRVAHRPRRAALGRRLPAGRGARARGLRCSTPAARPRSSPATSRPRAASPTSSSRRSAGARAGPRPGPGDDEQPDPRRRGLHLLRDDRRRPGRLPGRRRPERDPRRDVEHAQHAGRGARDRVPAAGRASSRCGAAAAATGRHRGGDGIVRELEALAPMRFTPDHRAPPRMPPRGRDGGGDGAPGRNLLNGEPLPAKARASCVPATGCGSRPRAAAARMRADGSALQAIRGQFIWRFRTASSRLRGLRTGSLRTASAGLVSAPSRFTTFTKPPPGLTNQCRSLSRNGP